MSIDATRWAWEQKTGKSSTKLILISIADRVGEDFQCYPSIQRLSADTELNRKTVIAGIDHLEKIGLLRDTGLRKGPTRKVKVYQLVGVPERNSPKNGIIKTVPKTEPLKSTENGTITQVTVPKTGPLNSPKNGTLNGPKNGTQNLSVEPKRLKEKLKEKEKPKKADKSKPKNTRFIKPTLKEITRYIFEKNFTVESESFFSHYESNGWRVGKNPMKNWKAAVRTWHLKNQQGDYATSQSTKSFPVTRRTITEAEWNDPNF